MNNQLLEKVIKSNNEPCPPFTYKNPLLDRNVATAVSRSFVKMLSLSKQNTNINNNLRLSVLKNIRKRCQIEPENHSKIDENFTDLLTKSYDMLIKDSNTSVIDATDKQLDAFLVRKMKEVDITSSYEATMNPEILQALINLNENDTYLDILSNNVIHWNATSTIHTALLKNLWSGSNHSEHLIKDSVLDDISIKMKPEIEKLLLETCHKVLTNKDIDTDCIFKSNNSLVELVKSCSKSKYCFQICCGVFNYMFIKTNFDQTIQKLIATFVNQVNINSQQLSFSVLYPSHLSSTVVLLDFAIHELPSGLREQYIQFTLNFLHKIHEKSENDFVMLLSHFPQWFDIYFT